MRLLQFSRCRGLEEFRVWFEDKENRTWFGQIRNRGVTEETVDLWHKCPSSLEPLTRIEYIGGTCFLIDSYFPISKAHH